MLQSGASSHLCGCSFTYHVFFAVVLFCFVVHEGDGEVFGRAERRQAIWELEPSTLPMLARQLSLLELCILSLNTINVADRVLEDITGRSEAAASPWPSY